MLGSTSQQSSTKQTPHSQRLGSYGNISNSSTAKSELDIAAKKEAVRLAKERIRVHDRTLELAWPYDPVARGTTTTSANHIVRVLDLLLHSGATPDLSGLPRELQEQGLVEKLTLLMKGLKPWLLPAGDGDKPSTREKPIYSYFREMVLFAMHCLKALHSGENAREHYRLLLPSNTGSDSKAKDSTQGFKIDQVLVLRPWCHDIGTGVSKWYYSDILAVVEAKIPDTARSVGKTGSVGKGKTAPSWPALNELAGKAGLPPPKLREAQGQMLCYSRHIYESQPNRAIIWGLTICGTLVRVYNSGPDFVLSSDDLDVTSSGGRKQFVEWLVSMSLGEDDRRGFDTAVQFVDAAADNKYWRFDVPTIVNGTSSPRETRSYYSRGPNFKAGTSFGRNTRGFPATADINNIDEPNVYVKTAWQHVEPESDKNRPSELACLQMLAEKLGKEPNESVHIPRLEAGGVMSMRNSDGAPVPFTTTEYYGKATLEELAAADKQLVTSDLGDDDDDNDDEFDRIGSRAPLELFTMPRERRVFVTSPVCDPLNTAKSVDELIVVLYDAISSHHWALKECNLLHRDISANNIMIKRKTAADGGSFEHGLLIDYDCAIHPGVERVARPERTGTLPFMSVLNLEAHPNERTEIDDWESLIYVLCFLATFGINKVDREVLAEAREAGCFIRLKIKDWDTDRGMADIATYKRAHLYSRGMFRMTISSRFPVPKKDSRLPNYLRLRKLAIDLYMAMFQNKGVGKECRGTDDVDSDEDSQDTDQSDDNDDDDDDDTRQLLGGLTIEAGDSTDSPAVATSSDPFVNRAKESNRAIIIKSLYDKLEKHATKARERMGMGKGKSA